MLSKDLWGVGGGGWGCCPQVTTAASMEGTGSPVCEGPEEKLALDDDLPLTVNSLKHEHV